MLTLNVITKNYLEWLTGSGTSHICEINKILEYISNLSRPKRWKTTFRDFILLYWLIIHTYLAQTPEIGQGLGRFLSCGARKPEQT